LNPADRAAVAAPDGAFSTLHKAPQNVLRRNGAGEGKTPARKTFFWLPATPFWSLLSIKGHHALDKDFRKSA